MKNILIINGPNLNMLGKREPEIYGKTTLEEIENQCNSVSKKLNLKISFFQSNSESDIIDEIQKIENIDALIINAGAFTHTSIAIHDALKSYSGFKIELHISNPHLRETFRHVSYISSAVDAIIAGLGTDGYSHVIELLADLQKHYKQKK